MRTRIVALLSILLFAALPCLCFSQTSEEAWLLTQDPGFKAQFVQTDYLGDVYVLEQNSKLQAAVKIYDMFGDLIRTIPYEGFDTAAIGLIVNPNDGTAVILFADAIWGSDWDGNAWAVSGGGQFLAAGTDYGGRGIGVFADTSSGVTRVRGTAGGLDPGINWYVPYVATNAYVTQEGYVVLVGVSGTAKSGTLTATGYDENGNTLWTRSFGYDSDNHVSIAGLVEDQLNSEYLVVNTSSLIDGYHCYVECLDRANLNITLFTSSPITGTASMVAFGGNDILVAGGFPSPFVAGFRVSPGPTSNDGGEIDFDVSQAADGLAYNGSGPVVETYDSATSAVNVIGLSGTDGSVQSTISVPAATASDEGMIVGNSMIGYEFEPVIYAGNTGGTNSNCLIASIDFGANLQSVTLPASVQGGASISAQIQLTSTPARPCYLNVTANFPGIVPAANSIPIQSQTAIVPIPTLPVDANTVVTLTTTQSSSNLRRFAHLTVTTAALAGLASSASSLAPSATATGTVTLNSPAGPSGKVVALTSSNPGISVPASVKVLAGQSSATFTISSSAVSGPVNVSVMASLASVSASTSIRLAPAALKSLTVSLPSVIAGANLTGEAIIATLAGPAGDTVTLTSSSPAAMVPGFVVVPSGGTYKTFTVATGGVSVATPVTLTASFNGISQSTTFTVSPASLLAISVSPRSLKGGSNVEATVTLNGKAGSSGYVVSLKSGSAAVTVPATITIPAGASSFSFVLKTKVVPISTPVTVTATLGATTKSAALTLTP